MRHIPKISHNEFGALLLNDLFSKAQQLATYDLVCFVNSDIVITQSFIKAIHIVKQRWKHFVLTCSPWNLCLRKDLDFKCRDWEERLINLSKEKGKIPRPIGADIILFPRGFYEKIPPFIIGEVAYDNWLIFKARQKKIPLIDTLPFVFIVHQDHGNSTHGDGKIVTKYTQVNQRLAGWWARSFIVADTPYRLDDSGNIRQKPIFELLEPRIQAIMSCYIVNNVWRVIGYLKKRLKAII